MLAFPGSRVNKTADIPFINLAMLFNASYVNVFTDLPEQVSGVKYCKLHVQKIKSKSTKTKLYLVLYYEANENSN
jgi:hypothetical protein